MAISVNLPSTVRRPGVFHELDFTSAARGLTPVDRRIALVGMKTSAGLAAADAPLQIFTEAEADSQFGKGSPLALMVRRAMRQGRSIGFQPAIFGVPVAAPGGGTAAIRKITVTAGTAAAGADIVFAIGDVTLRAGVSAADDQDAVAIAIRDAVNEAAEFVPFTAAVNGTNANEVDLTYVVAGENGNDITVAVKDVGLPGLTIAATSSTAGAGVASPTNALAALLAQKFECIALENHKSADLTLLDTHLDTAWNSDEKRWRYAIVAETGTLSAATTLAGANDERLVVATYEGCPCMPGEIAAAIACTISGRAQPNYNWDGEELVIGAPADSDVYISSEVETALAGGATPLKPNNDGTTAIVRLITTKTTENSAPFERLKDLSVLRGMVFTIEQLDIVMSVQFKAENLSPEVIKRMRSVAYTKLLELETARVLRDVEALFGQLNFEEDPNVVTRAVGAIPEKVIQNLHQTVLKHVLID